jgi:hypothetical protein
VINSTLILLTYKGKVLLTFQESIPFKFKDEVWQCIGGVKPENATEQEAIIKLVEKEIGIRLDSVELLSKQLRKNLTENFYWAKLTDGNVNSIKREEGKLINFYSVSELKTLALTAPTSYLFSKHAEILEHVGSSNTIL